MDLLCYKRREREENRRFTPVHWTFRELNMYNKAFRHVETLFVQGNQVRTDQNKPPFL